MSKSLIFWCDGSAKPNPGFAGFGIYGYSYQYTDSKKNYKHPVKKNLYYTETGLSELKPTTQIEVIDIYEHVEYIHGNKSTNNQAELLSVIRTIELVKDDADISNVTIYTDSAYVVNCFNDSLPAWVTNSWKRIDNKEIVHLEEWKKIHSYASKLRNKNVIITLIWVKGHSDHYGNEIADLLSVIASNAAKLEFINNKINNLIILSQKIPYIAHTQSYIDKDFIYNFKDLYFSSSLLDDATYCFLYNTDEELLNIGRKSTESLFALNIGYVPELLSKIKDIHRKVSRSYTTTCCIKVNKLSNREILRLITLINPEYLLVRTSENSFSLVRDSNPFLFDVKPTVPLITNINKIFMELECSYNQIENTMDGIFELDISPLFIVDNKLIIDNSVTKLDLTKFIQDNINLEVLLKQKIILDIGHDIPSYLVLKSLEQSLEKIKLYIKINKENCMATIYCKLVLNDREVLVTNIVNKFSVVV